MGEETIRVLLVEDSPGDARLIREMLAEARGAAFELACVDSLSGLTQTALEGVNVLLLDLSLPGSDGLDSLIQACTPARRVPVVVLSGEEDGALAVRAVHEGAQDYLIKGQVTSDSLSRSLRYAMERHRLQAELRSLSLTDELTGLHNRRGFLVLAEQQLKLARRIKTRQLLVFVDVDGLKQINDKLGHAEGDRALFDVANILRRTCRQSDIIARLGGDEYVVLAIDGADGVEAIAGRLEANVKAFQAAMNRPYNLALSVGVATYNPSRPCEINELLEQADRAMHAKKQMKSIL